MTEDLDPVVRQLALIRRARGITQREVAERMGSAAWQPNVSKVERGMSPYVSLVWVRRYAAALGWNLTLELLPKAGRNASTEDRQEPSEADGQPSASGTSGHVLEAGPGPEGDPAPGG